jgi:hypothetical protein
MNNVFSTKPMTLLAVLALTMSTDVSGRDIKTGVTTQITGTLTAENDSLYISTSDFILADKRYPATHIGVWPCEQKSNVHYNSLLKVAGTKKQVTIRGFFRSISAKAAEGMDVPYAFCPTE